MEPSEIIRDAVKAVEDADVPDDLRAAAFDWAVKLLTDEVTSQSDSSGGPGTEVERASAQPAGPLAAAASRLGVPRAIFDDVFHSDGDSIGVGLAASRFDKTRSGGTRQLALLIAAARQAAGLEEWTPTTAIREVCRDYGKFDSANFASTLRTMGDVFNFRGRGHQLEVRLTRPGYERAAQLIQELAGA
jgi:hypothetical protein